MKEKYIDMSEPNSRGEIFPSVREQEPVEEPWYRWVFFDRKNKRDCAIADRYCSGASCMAWVQHPTNSDLGRCCHVPPIEE